LSDFEIKPSGKKKLKKMFMFSIIASTKKKKTRKKEIKLKKNLQF
jgi:hypothetical protein